MAESGSPFDAEAAPLIAADGLAEWGESQRSAGKRIVLTNGCFDLVHEGHVRSLFHAARLGDLLVVATNSDDSVAKLKGPGRPLLDSASRTALLRALRCVDAVTIFRDLSVLPTIEALRPDVVAKGAEYRPEEVVGYEVLSNWGGRVERLPMVKGVGTTVLLERFESARAGLRKDEQ